MTRKIPLYEIVFAAIVADDGAELRSPHEANLMLAAWNAAPARLGLRGHTDCYPDTKRIYRELLLLSDKKLIYRYGVLKWQLTDEGRRAIAKRRPAAEPEEGFLCLSL